MPPRWHTDPSPGVALDECAGRRFLYYLQGNESSWTDRLNFPCLGLQTGEVEARESECSTSQLSEEGGDALEPGPPGGTTTSLMEDYSPSVCVPNEKANNANSRRPRAPTYVSNGHIIWGGGGSSPKRERKS